MQFNWGEWGEGRGGGYGGKLNSHPKRSARLKRAVREWIDRANS